MKYTVGRASSRLDNAGEKVSYLLFMNHNGEGNKDPANEKSNPS